MPRLITPDNIAAPFSNYSHAIEIPGDARQLHISGQVGVFPDGQLAHGFAEQADQTWKNIIAILNDAGMNANDLVKINTLVTRQEDVPQYRKIRDRYIGDNRPASTLMVVAGLASPEWLIEVEAIAARY